MAFTIDESESTRVIHLTGNVDIASAADLRPVLIEALISPQDIEINLTEATGIDLTAIQLLWAATHAARKSHKYFAAPGAVPAHISATICEAGFDQFLVPTQQTSAT